MKTINIETWKRRDHFLHFKGLEFPYLNITANVDLSTLHPLIKEQQLSLFATLAYVFTRVSNSIPELRMRIRGEQVVEHDQIRASYTVLAADETFGFATIDYTHDFSTFHQRVLDGIERTRKNPSIHDEPGRDDMIFLTTVTWVSFSQVSHPLPLNPPDSFPRITWGKFFQNGTQLLMPLSLCANHSLVDGLHVGRFFEGVQLLFDHPQDFLH